LLDLVENEREYTIYNVNFLSFTNGNILSVVIKAVLKEGNTPQRTMIQTYNYDIDNDKIITLDEILKDKNIDKVNVQNKIIETVREKNVNTSILAKQGYNIYVRDIRSDEYLIENIKTFFVGEDGHIFIVFAYGNQNFTETMDILVL